MSAGVQFDSIIEKQKKRYLLLRRIYELTNGVETKIIQLEPPEGLSEDELLSTIDYLSAEGLIVQLADNAPLVQISHRGVVEIEESIVAPNKATAHFLPQVINVYGNVGSVLTGDQNTVNVSQNISDSEILELVRQLRRHLGNESSDSLQEGNDVLDGLETELNSASPNQSRIKFYLKGLGTFVRDSGKDLLVEIASKLISHQIGLP